MQAGLLQSESVSYTHLDVYKRQALESPLLKLVKGKPVGVVLDSQKKIPQEKRLSLIHI